MANYEIRIVENLFVPLGIEVVENRLLHENHKEAGDLCIRPIGVAVPLVARLVVGEGVELVHLVLHVGREGGERHPAELALHPGPAPLLLLDQLSRPALCS